MKRQPIHKYLTIVSPKNIYFKSVKKGKLFLITQVKCINIKFHFSLIGYLILFIIFATNTSF